MFVYVSNDALTHSDTMSSLISRSDLSQGAPQPGSDAGSQDQASSLESVKAASRIPYVSSPQLET